MKKKKYFLALAIIVIGVFIAISTFVVTSNKNGQETPINYLIESINKQNINDLPNAFHEYCSLCIEQNISQENFEAYINSIIKDFGNDYKVTYEIVNIEKQSDSYKKSYEENAFYTYSNYPFFANGGEIKFECIDKITANITIEGNKQSQNGEVDFLIVKIDGEYYFLHTPNQLMSMFINY